MWANSPTGVWPTTILWTPCRFSFLTNDNLFRIDLTVVKSNSKSEINFKKANILQQQEVFELEIEYIGSTKYNLENEIYKIYDSIKNILSIKFKIL